MGTRQKPLNATNAARQLAAKDWRERAAALRRQCYSIREIAKRVDRSPAVVGAALKEMQDAVPVEDIEAIRKAHAEKLEKLQRAHRKLAHVGDKDASDIYLKALAAERQLLGLNAPERSTVTVNTDDATLLARIAALAESAATGEGDIATDTSGEGAASEPDRSGGDPS